MQTIVVFGAGKTSVYLVEYLLANAQKQKWKIIVADTNRETIEEKINSHPNAEAAVTDINDTVQRRSLIEKADIVLSLMPPELHVILAKDCLEYSKHLITSSYISPEMRELDSTAREKGLMFMCEMGLDPGIDHMSGNQIVHGVQKVAAGITSFRSYTGGLVASESDSNPWHYKFSWSPRNVVLAGAAGARYLQNGKIIEIPYKEIFANPKKVGKIGGIGPLVYYPNRDSLKYLAQYDLPDVKTFMRATYRYQGYIRGWNVLVQLGLTDPNDKIKASTYAGWVREKNGFDKNSPLLEQVAVKMNYEADDPVMQTVAWLGIFEETPLPVKRGTSAEILQDLLQVKWAMRPEDKDIVIMRHEVEYLHKGNKKTTVTSTMVHKGLNSKYSAMAKTVGLPMAILAKLVLTKRINPPVGVRIPNMPAVYKPVLAELAEHGITFKEEIE